MGFFTDILSTIGLSDVGSTIDSGTSAVSDIFGGNSSGSTVYDSPIGPNSDGTDISGSNVYNSPIGPNQDGSTSGSQIGDITSNATGGGGASSAASIASKVGSALTSMSGSAGTNPIQSVKATGTQERIPLDTRGAAGKAQRAPTADPNAIWQQWENRLSYFVGKK